MATKEKKGHSEGDLVLIYHQEKPSVYARIESIEPDIKKDWYRVTLLLLTLPSQVVTWILREEYINGAGFTMGGQPVRLEGMPRVVESKGDEEPPPPENSGKTGSPGGKVIPLKNRS
jgi:hypothetical protein